MLNWPLILDQTAFGFLIVSRNGKMSQILNQIELRPNREGRLRAYIGGTRVRVQDVYALAELQQKSPDEIVIAL
ncbi:MAG TPA: hypothetical protein VFV87_08760, partial [Pirellulaceae bacterium]|nr:hypothetical protein [Pirellulaceae bacterium]